MKNFIFTVLVLVAAPFFLTSQKKDEKKKWDVSNPPGNYKEVEFSTSEGTWMNLDVSPDGKEIVFDLLGDIYSMPVTGGVVAKLLRGGHAFEVQPRYSPDGNSILYTSDKGGGDNIWIMNRDGSGEKQVTKEEFRLLNNAVWTPDGNYFIARKHFTSRRSLGAGELWMYHISGGEGIQLTKRKNDQQDLNEPCASPDGKFIYYSEDVYPGGFFQYNKDPNSQIYVIKRYDREKGESSTFINGSGGAIRPQVSPDGKHLAFIRRVREKTVLYLHRFDSGEQWPVYDKLSKDQQEAWAIFGVYTGFGWTPDNQHIIIWSEGKIKKINVNAKTAEEIPFTVKSKHRIYDAVHFQNAVSPDQFTAKAIRHAVSSPDGKWLVFNTAGYLWKKELPGGVPVRLTSGTDLEFEPSFSVNGNEIVYVTWNDEQRGAIYKYLWKDPKAKPVKLTPEKGIYRTPRFSPNGISIVYQKEDGNSHQGFSFSIDPGLYVMSSSGGKGSRISEEGEEPVFSSDGNKIYFLSEEGENHAFKSFDLITQKTKTLCTSKYTNRFVPSPDNNWIAFTELYKVYIAPWPKSGKSLDLGAKTNAIPVVQVARDAGINLHWSADSKKLNWTMGDEYFSTELKQRFKFVEGAPDSLPPIDTAGVKINLVLKTDKPSGKLVLKGARIITMKGDEVIENGVILVNENKIEAIGKEGEVVIPQGVKVVDVSGKTIIPGIVDVHAHLGTFRHGVSPQKQWSYYANLAYGVTTTHDPSSNSEMVFSQSEMVKAGNMVGPRIFSTGTILYGAEGDFKAVVNSLDDAKSNIRRTKAWGAFSVKSYNQPRREQRQQVIEAARQLGIMVYPEGGSFFYHNLSMVLDGHTGIEHNLPVYPIYNDVIQFWKNSKTGITPTLIVCYGALSGEYFWYQKTNVWEKARLLNFTPRSIIDSRSRHRTMAPDAEYDNGHILASKSLKKLSDAGVKVNLGSHGQLQGLGAHWELWMLAQGGMSPLEALRCATINGAEYIGMDKEIGSLEKGKLADLVILDKNPLENIQHSETVRYVMINGRLFDSETMNETGNHDRKRTKFFWEDEKYNASFPWHEHGDGFIDNCGLED